MTGNLMVTGSSSVLRACRAGHLAVSGFCMDANLRPAEQAQTAPGICADDGARVCTVGEYYQAAAVLGVRVG